VKLIVKIGGAALEDAAVLRRFARTVAQLSQDGHQVAVVHGGGAALSRTLLELGQPSQFVNGLRVTDSRTRDVAIMVLAGHLNKQLVAAIGAAGQPALGLCGGDLQSFRAVKKGGTPDLGFVGEICSVATQWLDVLWQHGAVPVISSIALGNDGQYYNVNADQMASACAVFCNAQGLVFLTDVPGVKDAEGEVIRWLDVKSIPAMIQAAIISGGIYRVRILPASQVDVLPGFFTQGIEFGTEVVQ
jgi:acetylglutamate kinase